MGILRTFLALAVVVFHSYTLFGYKLCGGQLAVEAFFIISGFYMALILNEKYQGPGYYKKFILGRLYRIYPVYWIVLILSILISMVGFFFFNNAYFLSRYISNYNCFSPYTLCLFVIENIIIIGQDMFYFMRIDAWCHPQFVNYAQSFKHSANQYLFVPQAWSISIELVFYALAPFIVKQKIKWQFLILSISFFLKWFFSSKCYLAIDPWTYRFFPFELGYFVLGSLAYQRYLIIKEKNLPPYIGIILLCMCLLSILFITEIPLSNLIFRQFIFYSIVWFSVPYLFKFFKDNVFDRYIGELSYSIYISHLLIVVLLRPFFFNHVFQMKYYGISVVIVSLAFAIILYHILIKPLEKWRINKISKII